MSKAFNVKNVKNRCGSTVPPLDDQRCGNYQSNGPEPKDTALPLLTTAQAE